MTEEVAKFAVSIIVICLLILLVANLTKIFIQNTEYEQAKSTVSEVDEALLGLVAGESKTILIESPKGWSFFSYLESNRLCLCKSTPSSNSAKNEEKNKLCVCTNTGSKIRSNEVCYPTIGILKNCINILKVPYYLKFEKIGEEIVFSSNNPVISSFLKEVTSSSEFLDYLKNPADKRSSFKDYLDTQFLIVKRDNPSYESFLFEILQLEEELFSYSPNTGFLGQVLDSASSEYTLEGKVYILRVKFVKLKSSFPNIFG